MINLARLPQVPSTRAAARRGTFALALQRALHRESLSWPLFCLLLACAERSHTITTASHALDITHQRVRQHLRRYPHLFLQHEEPAPNPVNRATRLALTTEGEKLLAGVLLRIK
jgi:hypothetical protein